MNSIEAKNDALVESPDDVLLEVELRIARRADQLAGTAWSTEDRNLEYWLRAEREVLAE